jgi:hypothetical protein
VENQFDEDREFWKRGYLVEKEQEILFDNPLVLSVLNLRKMNLEVING